MSKDYYKTWETYVIIMRIVLSKQIEYEKLIVVKKQIEILIEKIIILFGEETIKYCLYSIFLLKIHRINLHNLLHMVDDIQRFGPPKTHSAFSFESINGEKVTEIKS